MNKHTTHFRVGALALSIAAIGAFGYIRGAFAQNAPKTSNTLPDSYFAKQAPVTAAPVGAYDSWPKDLVTARFDLQSERSTGYNGNELALKNRVDTLTRAAIGNSERTALLAKTWAGDTKNLSDINAFSLLQNQKMIEQNAEIIALLKAKK